MNRNETRRVVRLAVSLAMVMGFAAQARSEQDADGCKEGWLPGALHHYIHFDTGRATIRPESRPIVDQITALLKQNVALWLSSEGHTDNVGTPASNKLLSEQRAKAVLDAVVASGVPAARLSSVGWGQEKPVADNRSEDGRAKNRRVEIVKK